MRQGGAARASGEGVRRGLAVAVRRESGGKGAAGALGGGEWPRRVGVCAAGGAMEAGGGGWRAAEQSGGGVLGVESGMRGWGGRRGGWGGGHPFA